MEAKAFALLVTITVTFRKAESCGPADNFDPVHVNETASPGHVLLNITAEAQVEWTLTLRGSADIVNDSPIFKWLQTALVFKQDVYPNVHTIQLTRTLDLEHIYNEWKQKLSVVQYQLHCRKGDASTTFELFVYVKQVNEYRPQFVGAPFNLSVPENAVIERLVLRLRDNATDKDVVTSGGDTDIHEFLMSMRPASGTADFHDLFEMSDKQNGEVRVGKHLDFEAFPNAGSAYVSYDVSVFDIGRHKTTTQLTIYIEDADDQPPQFYYPGCGPSPCEIFYICEVDYDFTGVVTNMSPADIKAKDGDTLGYHVEYRIRTGPRSPRFRRFVTIHPQTGVLKVLEPLGAYSKAQIVLIVQATEVSSRKHSSDTTVIVKIKYPDDYFKDNNNQTWTTAAPSKDSAKHVIVAVIVLAAFVLLAFMALAGLIIYLKKRPDKPVYPIEEDDGAEVYEQTQKLQRGDSNTDSGQWSMAGEVSMAGQLRASARSARGQPSMSRDGRKSARGLKKPASARSGEISCGEMSVISTRDIQPQEDLQNAMLFQENADLVAMQNAMSMNGNMALVQAQMHGMKYYGHDVLEEEDETDLGNGEGVYEARPQPRRLPPKSAPAGSARNAKTAKRAQSARKSRKEQSKVKRRDEESNDTKTYQMTSNADSALEQSTQQAIITNTSHKNVLLDPGMLIPMAHHDFSEL